MLLQYHVRSVRSDGSRLLSFEFESAFFLPSYHNSMTNPLCARTMCTCTRERGQLLHSKVDAVEQRDVFNSGVRGTKEEIRPTPGPGLVVSNI